MGSDQVLGVGDDPGPLIRSGQLVPGDFMRCRGDMAGGEKRRKYQARSNGAPKHKRQCIKMKGSSPQKAALDNLSIDSEMRLVTSPDCLFCKIADRKIETAILYEDDLTMGFRDINPKAPVHVIIISKEHIESLTKCEEKHSALLGHMVWVAKKLAETENLAKNGYRLVLNIGTYGGQTIPHLHFHVLGGRSFGWPPG